MCWEDVKIRRASPGRSYTLLLANGVIAPIIGPNKRRVTLAIMGFSGSEVIISTDPTPAATNGFYFINKAQPLVLPQYQYGQIVQQAFYALPSANGTLTLVEVETPLEKSEI